MLFVGEFEILFRVPLMFLFFTLTNIFLINVIFISLFNYSLCFKLFTFSLIMVVIC